MNLYIFNDNCSGAMYGIGTYIRELTTSLNNTEINICIIHLFSDIQQMTIKEKDGIKQWYFPKPIQDNYVIDPIKKNELYFRNITYLLKLHIKNKNNLIFHLNYNYNKNFPEALKAAFNCKIVTCVHYLNWCIKTNGNLERFKYELSTLNNNTSDNQIYRHFLKEKSYFEVVDQIICLCEYTRNIIINEYKISSNKINVVYNGLTDIKVNHNKSDLRNKYHIPNLPILLFVGRIEYNKGLIYALKAFRKVLKIIPCHFIIVGNGDFDLHMKECEDLWMNITWTGKLEKQKLYDIYSIADIGLIPSFTEQCSYTAIEMMMHSLPLIATTSAGLSEMIEEGYNGLQIPIIENDNKMEIDIDIFTKRIAYLLKNPEKRINMGQNARKKYLDFYSSEKMAKKMLYIYNR